MNNETPKEAARRLASQPIAKGFTPEALHEYCDAEGKAIYWRIRLKNQTSGEKWIRPMHVNEQDIFILGNPKFSGKKPLYRLPEIVKHLDKIIWITEGEWCCDHLVDLGLIATTSGSAESANKTDWSVLANRNVIIWRDNDDAGLCYARAVTEQLLKLNCVVQWIDIAQLNLPAKGDCVDWLALHVDADRAMIEALPRCVPLTDDVVITVQKHVDHHTENGDQPTANVITRFLSLADGVYFVDDNGKHRICSPLTVKAWVRDSASENWGRLLEFCDPDGHLHRPVIPMEMLKGSGDEVKGLLLNLGLMIEPGHRAKQWLLAYISNSSNGMDGRARCVTHTGWYENLFVLPDQTIGDADELVVYQGEYTARDYQQSGTLAEWRDHVATLCCSNSRLLLAVSCAFAATLLHLAGMESGGIHLVGSSSSGKTTALRVAASVFGSSAYVNRWRATTNGLEALAALRSDTLLILDEMAQVDPKEAGEIAYMLANGSGKARASKTGAARNRQEWRMLFLSAGEISLAQHMREAGKKVRAGQEVRLVDVPADAGKCLGIFEELHAAISGAELSQRLLEATTKYYGTAVIAFLQHITDPKNLSALPASIKKRCAEFVAANLPVAASGQVHRACLRFALIAVAGELAAQYGITGWQAGEATHAAQMCFKAWLEQRGTTGSHEDSTILAQAQSIFEAHGSSRFEELALSGCQENDVALGNPRIANRLGYKRVAGNADAEYFVFPQAFKEEICKGFDARYCAQLFMESGMLRASNDRKPFVSRRVNGVVKKLYHFIRTEPL
jgi:putative DNA primase/helicase